MSDQQYETISCLYKLLDLNETGVWDSDGTFYLNRPFSTSTLSKLKYRSFSTNIKSSLQNVQTPTLNCNLCANVEILNETSTEPANITSDELSTLPKLLTDGNINNQYTLNVLNQCGLKSYNNIYDNVLNLATYEIPLNYDIKTSIQTGLKRAKVELLKTLGLITDEENDKDNFDYMSFQYESYKLPLQMVTNVASSNVSALTLAPGGNVFYYTYADPNKYSLWQNASSGTAINKIKEITQYNIYGYIPQFTSIYFIANEATDSYYTLPTYCQYVQLYNGALSTKLTFTSDNNYSKFKASANYGLPISVSTDTSDNQYSTNMILFASNDALNTPAYFCAPTQRILLNNSEFALVGTNSGLYQLAVFDKNILPTLVSKCITAGLPPASYLYKFDSFTNFDTIHNVLYFLERTSTGTTWHFYTFIGSEVYPDSTILSNPALVMHNSISLTGNFDVLSTSDYKQWTKMIDTYNSPMGVQLINITTSDNITYNGMFVFTSQGYQWITASNFASTQPTDVVNFNVYRTYNCDDSKAYINASVSISNNSGTTLFYNRVESSKMYLLTSTNTYTQITPTQTQGVFGFYDTVSGNPFYEPTQVSYIQGNGLDYYFTQDNSGNAYWYPTSVESPSSDIRYTLANSMLSVNCWNGTFAPFLPTINEYGNTSSYNWCKSKHITPEAAQGYQYLYFNANDSLNNYIDNIFKWDQEAGTITFPNIPIYSTQDGKTIYGNILFYITFTTNPEVINFDPNIKQGLRNTCKNYYSIYKQVLNKTPSLYLQDYVFDNYFIILDEDYYSRINTYLALITTDLTLNFISPEFPTINNCVFQLNESSLVDFKESKPIPSLARVSGRLIDAGGSVLLKEDAQKLYSNITICIDWEFAK